MAMPARKHALMERSIVSTSQTSNGDCKNILTHLTEYKDMLTTVCANEMFGNKTVEFPNFPTTA
jgi:hypothetical protein